MMHRYYMCRLVIVIECREFGTKKNESMLLNNHLGQFKYANDSIGMYVKITLTALVCMSRFDVSDKLQ